VNRPLILLADEPTGNLTDYERGIMALLERINRTGTTVVVATHDEVLVDKMRRRVIELHNGTLVRDQPAASTASPRCGALVPEARPVGWLMPVSVDYVARETGATSGATAS